MFLVRYFLYAGGALLALLFLVDWYSPVAPTTMPGKDQMQETSLDKEILRIRSAQKWPQKMVFDTNIPTIVPSPVLAASAAPAPPLPLTAVEALNKSALNVHAEAKSVQAEKPSRKVARHRKAVQPQAGAYPVASAWSPWW